MIRWFQNIKLRNKMLLVLICAVALILIAEVGSRRMAYVAYDEQLYQKTVQVLTTFSSEVETKMQQMQNMTYNMIGDSILQKNLLLLRDSASGSDEWFTAKTNLNMQFSCYSFQNEICESLAVFTNQMDFSIVGNTFGISDDQLEKYTQTALDAQGGIVFLPEKGYFTFVREIRQVQNLNLSTLGIIVARINLGKLLQDCSANFRQIGVPLNVSVYNQGNCLYADPNQRMDIDFTGNGWCIEQDDFVVVYTSAKLNCSFVVTTPYQDIRSSIRSADIRSFLIVILTCIFAVLLAMILLDRSVRELSDLTNQMDDMGTGMLPEQKIASQYASRKDEIARLYRHFYRMSRDYQQLTEDHYNSMVLLKDAQFARLQKQIQPHFLFNTLAAVSAMAYQQKDEPVAHLVERLAGMLRMTVSEQDTLIPVANDLKMVQDYLYIQQIRYGERLQAHIDIPEAVQRMLIPPITLQPIVENSIIHALEEMLEPCQIRIRAECTQIETQIIVEDNGPGFAADRIEGEPKQPASNGNHGIALKNIHRRLQMVFSKSSGLTVQRTDGWTQVIVHLPNTIGAEGKHDA